MGRGPTLTIMQQAQGDAVVHLRGKLDRAQATSLWQELVEPLKQTKPPHLILDFQEVTGMDTAGAALLRNLKDLCGHQGTELTHRHLSEAVQQFLQYMEENASSQPPPEAQAARPDFISRFGNWGWEHLQDTRAFLRLLGDFLVSGPKQLLQPRRLHLGELFYQIQLVGVGAVPLLMTLSLLLGALMVFQGMKTVSNFGNPAYIADMVVIAVSREMGPLLTAVILAGRSGAAFAAEIGTMKLNEEVDALAVHNFDITGYLVLPRVFALMVAGPILTMISDATGILGGLVTSEVVMQLPAASFLHEAQAVFGPSDIYTGLIKGAVFGAFIGLIGCFRGLRTGLGAGSVGIQTTSAVVTGIFVVIFLDTMFSYIFQMYGW
jgi:phospholipid/cholesterol/gamma-HCH transport system permease protein